MVEKSISGAILVSKTHQKSKKNRLKTLLKKDSKKTKKKEPTGPPKGPRGHGSAAWRDAMGGVGEGIYKYILFINISFIVIVICI